MFEKTQSQKYNWSRERHHLEEQLEAEAEARRCLEGKHEKEIEHLKLIQAQELYIIKKR